MNYPRLKRAYDALFAALGLLLLSPVFGIVAALVKLADGGPVFYRQRRIGLNGQPFEILKFRSMVLNADRLGPPVTRDRDPRITWIGRYLRKGKLDELPQLWNVLRGDMSFVGPRPEVPRYVALYTDDQKEILRHKPGITDLATLVFRDEETLLRNAGNPEAFYIQHCIPRKISLNKEYAERASLIQDTLIVLQTICPYWIGILLIYITVLTASLLLSYELRFDFDVPALERNQMLQFLPWVIGGKLALLLWRRQFKGLLSYFGIPELRQIAISLGLASALLLLAWSLSRGAWAPPRSVVLIDFIVSCALVCGTRVVLRLLRENYFRRSARASRTWRVGIVGAGDTGARLAKELFTRHHLGIKVFGFFDDNPDKWNKLLHEVPVLGMPELLLQEELALGLDEVIIATPEVPPSRLAEIVHLLAAAKLRFRAVPSLEQLMTGNGAAGFASPGAIEPLLVRQTAGAL